MFLRIPSFFLLLLGIKSPEEFKKKMSKAGEGV